MEYPQLSYGPWDVPHGESHGTFRGVTTVIRKAPWLGNPRTRDNAGG